MTEIHHHDMIEMGSKFIQKRKIALKWSLTFPIINFFIQISVISFILIQMPPPGVHPNPQFLHPPNLFDIITPPLILLICSIFAFIQYSNWVQLNQEFKTLKEQNSKFNQLIQSEPNPIDNLSNSNDFSENSNFISLKLPFITLSKIFYTNRERMERIKSFFVIINIVGIFSLRYFIRLIEFDLNLIPPGPIPPAPPFIHFLDYLAHIGLFFYLITQWKMFITWHRYFSHFDALEKQIQKEVFMNDKNR